MSFTYAGINSDAFGIIVTNIHNQVLPGSNHKLINIPGKVGSYLQPREPKDRRIIIDCTVPESSLEALNNLLIDIAAWLYKDDWQVLTVPTTLNKYYLAVVIEPIDLEQVIATGKFSVIFEAHPHAFGSEVITNFANDTVTVNNIGTCEVAPIFETTFTAAASEWKVIGPDSNYIRVVHDFQFDDTLEVNAATGAVLINGTRAMEKLDWANSRYFPLRVGESKLDITPTEVCTTRVSWIPRYL